MPKASKKRKDKAADFAKAKLKLGKGKQLANNAIDTSFKARSIALPSQSVALDKDTTAPSTKRKLTFEDLVSHLKHYNANTRKDAILGFRELLEAHPELVESNLTALLNACVRLIGDEDASVRKSLLSFFVWMLPRVPLDDLRPHTPLLLLFTTSAQTHIYPEIRIDAVRFLDVFLDILPDVVVAGWTEQGGVQRQVHGGRVLEGYLGIMNAGTSFGDAGDTGPVQATSTASVTLSPASKLVILKSLASFLRHAISPSTNREGARNSDHETISTWYLSSAFSSPQAFDEFDNLLKPSLASSVSSKISMRQRYWEPEATPDTTTEGALGLFPLAHSILVDAWSLRDLSDAASSSMNSEDAHTAVTVRLAHTLYSTLIATFLDCAPTVFSPNGTPPEVQLQTVVAVAKVAHVLYGFLLVRPGENYKGHAQAREELDSLLRKMGAYFPFRATGMQREMQTEDAFQELNLIFCELASLLLLSPQAPVKSRKSASSQIAHVSAHIVRLLRGEPPTGGALGRPLSAQAYAALLPSIWALLAGGARTGHATGAGELLSAVLEHAVRGSSTSATKRLSVEFVGRLVLLDTAAQYRGALRLPSPQHSEDDGVARLVQEWLLHLPKTLWELGSRDAAASEVILRLLLRLAQRCARSITPDVLKGLRARLAPFFNVAHATRGSMPGPWVKLATPLRTLALDVVLVLLRPTGDEEAQESVSLREAITAAVMGTEEEAYWVRAEEAIRS